MRSIVAKIAKAQTHETAETIRTKMFVGKQ